MANSKLKNRKLVSKQRLQVNDYDQSSILKKIANPAGTHNPTGGLFKRRDFLK